MKRRMCIRGLVTTAFVLAMASPALAFSVRYEKPDQNSVLTDKDVIISAAVYFGSDLLAAGQQVELTVAGPHGDPLRRQVGAKAEACQVVSFGVSLAYNGRYEATIAPTRPAPASGEAPAGCVSEERSEGPRVFFLAVAPARPEGVKATVDSGRVVTVSWAANPEPDITGYRVLRAQGAAGFAPVGDTAQPSFKDTATPQAPGDYRYQVVAIRRGKNPDERLTSEPSAAVSVRVPPPGVPVTGAARAAGGAGRGGNLIDLAKFKADFQRLGGAGPGDGSDGGFGRGLPYGDDEELGAGEEELGTDEMNDTRRRTFVFISAGLLMSAFAAHVWWLRRESGRESLEALPPH